MKVQQALCWAFVCLFLYGCGAVPTVVGEGVRGVIDRTEDAKPSSDAKVIY